MTPRLGNMATSMAAVRAANARAADRQFRSDSVGTQPCGDPPPLVQAKALRPALAQMTEHQRNVNA
jgi:hypothetical protein